MKRWPPPPFRLLALVAMLLVSGCASDPTRGYAAVTTFPTDVQTVAVPIFENDTFDRDVEFELTDAIVKEIESRTPYKVVPRRRADTLLTGRIRKVERDQLSRSALTGLSEEMIVSVTLDFQWLDLRSDKRLVERQAFSGHGLFVPSRPTNEPMELGRFSVVQELARAIVDEMQAAW